MIIMSAKINYVVTCLSCHEWKPNQTLHGKCYLCTKPGCSGAANNGDSESFGIDGNFSVVTEILVRRKNWSGGQKFPEYRSGRIIFPGNIGPLVKIMIRPAPRCVLDRARLLVTLWWIATSSLHCNSECIGMLDVTALAYGYCHRTVSVLLRVRVVA